MIALSPTTTFKSIGRDATDRMGGTWERLNAALRERVRQDRHP